MNIYKTEIKEEYIFDEDGSILDEDLNYHIYESSDKNYGKFLELAAHMKNISVEVFAMKQYESDMRKKRVVLENKQKRIKEYIKTSMESLDIKKIKGAEFDISLRKSKPSVHVDNAYQLPGEFIARTEVIPDKNKIAQALAKGEEVRGASLIESNTLVVK